MTEDNATKIIKGRERLDAMKTKLAEAKAEQKVAEDQLAAADDAVDLLGLDPERDLERQVTKLCQEAMAEIEKLEEIIDDVDVILSR